MRNDAYSSHLKEQRMENVQFLRDAGVHEDEIARRLGMSVSALRQMIGRSSGKSDTGAESTEGEGAG